MSSSSPFRHELLVRYQEVDMQKIVFNAHYLSYVDEACDRWFRSALGGNYTDDGFDIMLKRAELTWAGSATWGDTLAIDVAIRRWGTTSFDVGFQGSVGENPVFEAVITYVSVDPGTNNPTPVPENIRAALS
jgi:acyl-CoA thioester hydrolase